MADDDAPDEGGLEPADDEETLDAPVEDAEADEDAEETYTRSQLAELLPHFDRFATHPGDEAVRQYGSAYDNSRRLISQGGHLTRQEEEAYRAAGIDPEEVQAPAEPEYETPGLFGVPWGEPTTWDEVNLLANSDVPEHKERAARAVLRDAEAPEDYKQAYWDNAYGQGSYRALSNQQAAMREDFERREAELEARILERLAPVQQAHTNTYVDGVISRARAEIKGFTEHADEVSKIIQEREAKYPGYGQQFANSDPDTQIAEFKELTLIAASRAAPQRKAAQQAAVDAAEAAKRGQVTETGRTNGQPETEQSAMKRRSVEDAKRVGGRVY